MTMRTIPLTLLIIVLIFLSACTPKAGTVDQQTASGGETGGQTSSNPTESAQPPESTATSTPVSFSSLTFWIGSAVPEQLRNSLGTLSLAADEASADLRLDVSG